ncbi:3-keto-disaccharide hydrolase [Novipirellula sp. SH528]|uniref:3-keto-disaccharide hydrolase n=1 Tax=Novipirellula sp. SH528 TaxID=3454466 RepID=UPI003FA0BB3F
MVRFSWFFAALAVFTYGFTLAGREAFADDYELKSMSLFDGDTLAGWEGNGYWFRIEDDVIVAGRLDEKIPHNEFLCTMERFADFDLRLEAKLVSASDKEKPSLNAGVQFRTKRIPGDTEVSGYQADMGMIGDRSIWGALYDESRRRKFLAEPAADLPKDLVKVDDWNSIRVRCEGPRIQIFINGVQTVDYTETDDAIPRDGIIGLQIHSGPPAEAHYRNIRIRNLTSK